MNARRTSLGPSDAKMDAALIRNLQRLATDRATEIETLRAQVEALTARGEAMEAALTNIRPVAFSIWKGGAFARGDGVLQIIEWIDAVLRTDTP
jgi:uncharacterized protein YlxW (UPF0749 family)